MSATLITSQVIAKEALMQLENAMTFGKLCHTEYKKEFVKVGNTVSIRKPVKFVASDGASRSNQNVTESSVDIVISKRKHVSWGFSMNDLTLSIEDYSKRYIKPAMITLANQVESDIASLYKQIPTYTGVAGTTPAAFSTIAGAARLLDEGAVPDDGNRSLILDPAAKWSMADVFKGYYSSATIEKAIRQGSLGVNIANCEVYGSQNIQKHTSGTGANTEGAPLINGASQEGSSLVTDGWTAADTILEGDRFTIAGVYAVNPVSRQSTGQLQRFVATADATADGSGNATISISPPIIASGAYQTVNSTPADGVAIQSIDSTPDAGLESDYTANLMFHKNCLALVMVPLEMPESATFKARESHNGYSVRVVKFYDGDEDYEYIRLDVLYGVKAIYPELGCVIMG